MQDQLYFNFLSQKTDILLETLKLILNNIILLNKISNMFILRLFI